MTPALVSGNGASRGATSTGIDRRGLLVGGGAVLAGLLVAGAQLPLASLPVRNSSVAVDALSAALFVPYVGSSFAIRTSTGGTSSLELIEVAAIRPHAIEPALIAGEAFSLLFEGSLNTVVDADHHQLIHEALELPPLYLSPIGRSARVQEYEAIVDHRTFDFDSKEN